MTCPNCKCIIPKSMDRCGYCGYKIHTGTERTLSVEEVRRMRLSESGFERRAEREYRAPAAPVNAAPAAESTGYPQAVLTEVLLIIFLGGCTIVLLLLIALLMLLL